MRLRLHPGLVILIVVALCAAAVAGILALRSRNRASLGSLLARLPARDGVVLVLDVESLRRNGTLLALTGLGVTQEPEYQVFVKQTGFDIQRDLDLALAWFGGENTFFVLRGKFDWGRLRQHVRSQGGSCRNAFCQINGSTPKRKISFYPIRRDVLGLAVAPVDGAAWELASIKPARSSARLPEQPVWMSIPAAALKNSENLPSGTRLFAKAMEGSENILLSLAMTPGKLEVLLDATCPSAKDASGVLFQLQQVTRLLKGMIAVEGKSPNPADLSSVLTAGTFRAEDRHVFGRWPIDFALLEGILGSSQ